MQAIQKMKPNQDQPITSAEVRTSTARVMADGRWRTAQDVATRIGGSSRQAGIALMALVCENRAVSEVVHHYRTYRMPGQEAAQ